MEWSPPPALTYPDVCGQNAENEGQSEHSRKHSICAEDEGMMLAERKGAVCVRQVDSPNHRLDLLPVRRVDLVPVLWSHQHGSKAEGRVLQAGPVAFDNS